MKWIPYTYLIGWKEHNKFYYGSKYGKDANPSTFWKNYFTSSKYVDEFRINHGEPDIIKIRKTFSNIEDTTAWEYKFLQKVHAQSNDKFLNRNQSPSLPIFHGDENHAKRPDVRKKMSIAAKNRKYLKNDPSIIKGALTKRKQNLIKFFLYRKYNSYPRNLNQKIFVLEGYIKILEDHNHTFRRALLKLRNLVHLYKTHIPKTYPKNRNSKPRGKMNSISIARTGKKWYYNPVLDQNICCKPGYEPTGFEPGLRKCTPNTNTEEVKRKISIAQKHHRANESNEKKIIRINKWRKTINDKKIYDENCKN